MTDGLFETMAADSAAGALRAAPSPEMSRKITELGEELCGIEVRIAKGEELLKELKTRKDIIMRRDLVDAMDEIGQDILGIARYDVTIVTEDFVHASLPNPDGEKDEDRAREKAALRRAGLDWLVENDHDALIKTVVTIELPRGAVADAQRIKALVEALPELDPETGQPRDNGPPLGYIAQIAESVHWGTLTSFVKEQLKRPDVVLPLEQLGAMVGRIAKIVKRKKK